MCEGATVHLNFWDGRESFGIDAATVKEVMYYVVVLSLERELDLALWKNWRGCRPMPPL